MENDTSRDIEFSLVDVILPLAEMWKILLLLPTVAAGMVYLALQFYPADLTYTATVHLPETEVRTTLNEEALVARLTALTAEGVELPAAGQLLNRLQIVFSKHDETRLTLTLPRREASPQLLAAIVDMLRPGAEAFLAAQKSQAEADVLLGQRTVENLRAGSAAQNAALESARQADPDDVATVTALTHSLVGVANALWSGQNVLFAAQQRVSELASAKAIEPFGPKPDRSLLVALAGGGTLLLVLVYIYIRQEFLYALSHANGRQKVARIMQSLKTFRGGKPTRP